MKKIFKRLVKIIIPLAVRHYIKYNIFDGYAFKSYSQEGEDLILRRIFEYKKNGFYVDVGAHHPKRFSNTYIFYLKGWRGINIDAMPGAMKAFDKTRPKDINIEAAVSDRSQTLVYHIYDEPAVNGFSEPAGDTRDLTKYQLLKKIPVETYPLAEILRKYTPNEQHIDFMSIDVEGFDLDVLKSNDWNAFCPQVIIVEVLEASANQLENNPMVNFLRDKGYIIYSKLVHSVVFKLK